MKAFAILPLVLVTACASQPPAQPDLTTLKQQLDAAQAGDFGELIVHMHKAETQLDSAEYIYQKMQKNGGDSALQRQGEQAAQLAAAHRANAEQALGRILRPLEATAETAASLDNRLAYLENLHIPADLAIPEQNLYFASGSARILNGQKVKLDKIVEFLKNYPVFAMELKGYADTVGSSDANRRLAANRNQAVLQALRKRGLPTQTLVTIAVGEVGAVNGQNNPGNRRVEIRPYVHGRYAERLAASQAPNSVQ